MARVAAVSDTEILTAIEVIGLAKPGQPITASQLRDHFGRGHLSTYQNRLDALRQAGQIDCDHDPLVEVLFAQALEHATALRQALHGPYQQKVAALEAELETQKANHREKLAGYQNDLKLTQQKLDTQSQATAAAESRAATAQAERLSAQESLAEALRELNHSNSANARLQAACDQLAKDLDNAQQQVRLTNQALGQANHEKEQATHRAQAQVHQEKTELKQEIQRLKHEQEKDRQTLRDQHDERKTLLNDLSQAQARVKELSPIVADLNALKEDYAALSKSHAALQAEHGQLAARAGEVQAIAHTGHRLLLTWGGDTFEAPLPVPLAKDAVLRGARVEGKMLVFPFLDLSLPLKALKPANDWLSAQLAKPA